MRLKEPFRGLYLMGGHTIFHFALLVAGLVVLGFPEVDAGKKNEDIILTMNLLRLSHALDIFFAILKFLGSAPHNYVKHRFSFRVMDTVKLFVYVGSVMYAIFHEQQYLKRLKKAEKPEEDEWNQRADVWILLEMLVFFGQVLCSVFFLMALQCKSVMGHNLDPTFSRFKTDALEYYEEDISWFSFIFVMWGTHLFILGKRVNATGKEDNDIKTFFSAYQLILRSTHLYFLMPYRNAERKHLAIGNMTWGILGFFEFVGLCIIFGFKYARGIATGEGLIDATVFLGQFILYRMQRGEIEKSERQRALINETVESEAEQPLQSQSNYTSLAAEGPKLSRKDKWARPVQLEDSIYDYAFVTLLDPAVIDEWAK
jgi:hypothetical protein